MTLQPDLMNPILYRLITSQDRRLPVEQIKHHPFFYGVNWNAIRQIDAPFIPRLKSITDTSYFPTDELEQVPEEPVAGDTTGANKDLAFLGYVIFMNFSSPGYIVSGRSHRPAAERDANANLSDTLSSVSQFPRMRSDLKTVCSRRKHVLTWHLLFLPW